MGRLRLAAGPPQAADLPILKGIWLKILKED
jgi:hypothetical protein